MTEQEIKAKRLEILEDTVKYYSEDTSRRALEIIQGHGSLPKCKYITTDNKKRCAVGRLISDDKIEQLKYINNTVESIFIDNPEILSKDIKLVGKYFMQDLQYLHDLEDNWDICGITKKGKLSVEQIKEKFIY